MHVLILESKTAYKKRQPEGSPYISQLKRTQSVGTSLSSTAADSGTAIPNHFVPLCFLWLGF